MHDQKKPLQVKSYTEIFGSNPYKNIFKKRPSILKEWFNFQALCAKESEDKSTKKGAKPPAQLFLNYEKMNEATAYISRCTLVRSTSTLFYDLDIIAKSHSVDCLSDLNLSNVNVFNKGKASPKSMFVGKSDAIVQECFTEVQAKFAKRDSKELIAKKVKRKFPQVCILSSDIFLRDENTNEKHTQKSTVYYDINDISTRNQKIWSYAKYQTELTKPISEEKKKKKKDRGKRIEDPCPCQLFSYACPCSDKKSLTELAKNNKSFTVAHQITSTTNLEYDKKTNLNIKKQKKPQPISERIHKLTSMSGDGIRHIEKQETEVQINESIVQQFAAAIDTSMVSETRPEKKISRNKIRRRKIRRSFLCPKCKENVDVSCTDDDNGSAEVSKHELNSTEKPECKHEPCCEMVPLCQILPNDNNYVKYIKHSATKSAPRVIRITKACRHHPPCVVVPSCQRGNVLKSKCEYIPPCLHRPRCINLPLCSPFSKSLQYDEPTDNYVELENNSTYSHSSQRKHIPLCQHESLENNVLSQVQDTCEFLGSFQSPGFLINPNPTCIQNTYTSCPTRHPPHTPSMPRTLCQCCKANKSCQYECIDCKCQSAIFAEETSNGVIFIRDVGCQFKNKAATPNGSVLQTRVCYTSSASCDPLNMKSDNFYANTHTVRCEEKFTSPISGAEYSMSTDSITSMEIDADCPSHGHRLIQKTHPYGFTPNTTPYIGRVTTHANSPFPRFMAARSKSRFPVLTSHTYIAKISQAPAPKETLKCKCRKMLCVKRRRKPRAHQVKNSCSGKVYTV